MKRITLIAFLLTLPLHAQDETGTGAATTATVARSSNNWKSWAFAGAALVIAAAGITIVTLDQGHKSP